MVNESKAHITLKERATDFLLKNGFDRSEVFWEYRFHYKMPSFLDIDFWGIADVVGISEERQVAIDCGEPISCLRKYAFHPFGIFYILPYTDWKHHSSHLRDVLLLRTTKLLKL